MFMNDEKSGFVGTSIDSILDTFKTKIEFLQPIYEAITNSLEAGAKTIEVKFIKSNNIFDYNRVEKVIISDDGEGFNEKNISSFAEYMSKYKVKLGCKGVGRFTWLKVFKKVDIESESTDLSVKIDFSRMFNAEKNIHRTKMNNTKTGTTIVFSQIISDYSSEEINLINIKKDILDYFFLKFLDYKKENKEFEINLYFEEEKEKISSEDIHDLSSANFELDDYFYTNKKYVFDINYCFTGNGQKTKNECFLCGNGRIVEKYKLDKLFSNLPDGKFIKVLVYSKYFDERINDERTAFTFEKTENNPTLLNPIPFPEISKKLESKLESIILTEFPEIENSNEKIIKKCIDLQPHLAKYIKEDKSIIKNEKDVIDRAEREFEKEKEKVKNKFLDILNKKNIDSEALAEEFKRINELSSRELAQYFLFRQTIIDSLKKLEDNDEKIEKYLHKLFLDLGEKSTSVDTVDDRFNNCIWLLDDKYMSYELMYSDTKISKIKKEIKEATEHYHALIEPDLTIFYSNKDIVVVEFKAIGASADDRLQALPEITRNLSIIAKNFEGINNIYGYIITKFDENFIDYISEQNGVMPLYSNDHDPSFYVYNNNIKDKDGIPKPTHIYIISTKNIYKDANARNKYFIDIIKNI